MFRPKATVIYIFALLEPDNFCQGSMLLIC